MKTLAALAFTPWAVFITSTSSVYLQNQEEFDYEYQVYGTVFLVASLVTLAAFLLFQVSKKSAALQSILAAYYVFGPAFLIYNALPHQDWTPLWDTVLAVAIFVPSVALALFLRSKMNSEKLVPEKFINLYSFFFLLMAITDVSLFVTRFEMPPPDVTRDQGWYQTKNPEKTLPNIYHFLFDGYQTDYFLNSLKEDAETDAFDGFILFENNYSVFGLTRDSLVSIFSSALPTDYQNEEEYRLAAFQGQGLVFGLNRQGYKTICLNCRRSNRRVEDGPHKFGLNSMSPKIPSKVLVDNSFYVYWFESYFPEFLTAPFQQEEAQIPTEEQFRLKKSRPVVHYQAYKEFLDLEPRLSPKNRYTFIHMLIPHNPYVLRRDCSFSSDLQPTDRFEQAACAYSMVKRLIDLLKHLGRFDDSVIVIHADHGVGDIGPGTADSVRPLVADSKDVTVREAVNHLVRRRALLLVKPVSELAPNEFIKRQTYTSLLDVAPTIYGMAGVPIPKHFRGRDLSKRSRITAADPIAERKFVIFDDRHDNAAYQITDGAMRYLGDANKGYSSELKQPFD
jgi:hypothetical protein